MPTLDYFLRMRNGVVAVLVVIAITMYLLPPAYLMVQHTRTGIPVSSLLWATSREVLNLFCWFPLAGLASVGAVIFYRADVFGFRMLISLAAASAWLFLIVNLITFVQFAVPGWLTFVLGISLLAYPPYFALRWILRGECRFSGSILEHLAFFASFALPQMYVVFTGIFDPKFFDFFF